MTTGQPVHIVHLYHPAQGQTSIFDYEGWAHPRSEYWSEHPVVGDLNAARKWAMENGRNIDKDYITTPAGIRRTIKPRLGEVATGSYSRE